MNVAPRSDRAAAAAAEPACAALLASLSSGRALLARELARETGLPSGTVATLLARLQDLHLLAQLRQGGRSYYRLNAPAAALLERAAGLAARPARVRVRTGPRDPALRRARSCYGHLAGELGVWLFERLAARGLLTPGGGVHEVTQAGARFFADFGVAVTGLGEPACGTCLDWSVRRPHLAGSLGKALLARLYVLGWAAPGRATRAVRFTSEGEAAFTARFG